jgi:hypothetical protein
MTSLRSALGRANPATQVPCSLPDQALEMETGSGNPYPTLERNSLQNKCAPPN